MKRRLLAIFLSLTLMLSLVPTAWASEESEDTYQLTTNFTGSSYYDSGKIASVAIKSIAGEEVEAASTYSVAAGAEIVAEVTYAENADHVMAALG